MNLTLLLQTLSVSCLIAFILLLIPTGTQAEFYKYKDARGSLVITNKLEDVPKKYRKRVKVVWDEELAAKDPLARRAAAAEARREQQQPQQKEKQGGAGNVQPSNGKTLVITVDEETGQLIRTME